MNGIDYSSLVGNTGLFSGQTGINSDVKFNGSLTGVNSKAKTASKSETNKQTNTDSDTYEHSTQTAKAGYDRPKSVNSNAKTDESEESTQYKKIDSDGIQEGVELSDAAKNLLAELREKYGNMDISVANWSSDEEQDYYASQTSKEYSVLINPDLLEEMAADESVREQYESVLSNAGEASDTIKEALGDDADKVKSFSITIDADGNVSYAVQLLKDMAESNKSSQKVTISEQQKEKLEEKRAEKKAAQKEAAKKAEEEKLAEKQETEKVEAGSIDELIAAIKAKLYPEDGEEDNEQEEE
jgi:hypothetical protein